MKKILIFTDAHGNYESLKAIIPYIKQIKPDYIFSAGDLIGIGPSHNEVLELVTSLENFHTVRGNHEGYFIDGFHNPLSCLEGQFHDWVRKTLDSKYHEYLENLPFIKYFNIDGIKIALTHYARNNDKFTTIENNRTYESLLNLFKDIDADIIIYGHDHAKTIIKGKKTFINIGTLGCNNLNIGQTKFGILTISDGDFTIEEIYVDYDISPEITKLDELNVPDKELIKRIFLKK